MENKHILLDLHCTDGEGREFIVEVQKRTSQYFYMRALYYATRAFNLKLSKGSNNYRDLKLVYLIALLSEPLKEPEFQGLDELYLWYCMCEKTHKCFAPNGINLIFANLSKAAKEIEDCKSINEGFCKLIRDLGSSTTNPEAFKREEYVQLAKAAALANIGENRLQQYETNLMNELDYKNWLFESRLEGYTEGRNEGYTEGREEGHAEGIAEGEARGEAKKAFSIARAFLSKGIPMEIICEGTGLSIEEVKQLKSTL